MSTTPENYEDRILDLLKKVHMLEYERVVQDRNMKSLLKTKHELETQNLTLTQYKEEAEETIKSISTMLGWTYVPLRVHLEFRLQAMKDRIRDLEKEVSRFHEKYDTASEDADQWRREEEKERKRADAAEADVKSLEQLLVEAGYIRQDGTDYKDLLKTIVWEYDKWKSSPTFQERSDLAWWLKSEIAAARTALEDSEHPKKLNTPTNLADPLYETSDSSWLRSLASDIAADKSMSLTGKDVTIELHKWTPMRLREIAAKLERMK